MKRRWTAISAAVVLVAMAAVAALAPTGYVVRAPGPATDLIGTGVLTVDGQAGTVPSGHILATWMTQTPPTGRVTLVGLVASYLRPHHDVLPRDAVYTSAQTTAAAADQARQDAAAAQEEAVVAALRQAGREVVERPKVMAVRVNGSSWQHLLVGDLVLELDSTPVATEEDVRALVRNKQIGDQLVVTVIRGEATEKVTIPKVMGAATDATIPSLGVTWGIGYSYSPDVQVNLPPDHFAASEGLAIALATYDQVSGVDLTAGATVAAVGRVSDQGVVTAVSGMREHAMSAWSAHAQLLVIPAANCSDLTEPFAGMAILPVTSLSEAVDILRDKDRLAAAGC